MMKGEGVRPDDPAQSTVAVVSLGALRACCLAFTAAGVVLAGVHAPEVLSSQREVLDATPGPPVDPRTLTLVLGITGGSIVGQSLAHLALAVYLQRGERWAWRASVAALGAWWVVSAVSLARAAWWSAAVASLVPVVLVGGPLLALRGHARLEGGPPPIVRGSPAWWTTLVCGVGALSGVVIALGGTSPIFDPWRSALADAHSGGVPSPPAEALVADFFGLIGGSTLAQFVMLAALARHRVARGDARALDWGLVSFLGWLVVDSSWSLVSDGAFNVLLVNAPFASLALPILVWARLRVAREASRPAI